MATEEVHHRQTPPSSYFQTSIFPFYHGFGSAVQTPGIGRALGPSPCPAAWLKWVIVLWPPSLLLRVLQRLGCFLRCLHPLRWQPSEPKSLSQVFANGSSPSQSLWPLWFLATLNPLSKDLFLFSKTWKFGAWIGFDCFKLALTRILSNFGQKNDLTKINQNWSTLNLWFQHLKWVWMKQTWLI